LITNRKDSIKRILDCSTSLFCWPQGSC